MSDRIIRPGGQYAPPEEKPFIRRASTSDPNPLDHRLTGFAVGVGGFISESILSHPFISLRSQCQVHSASSRYHLTPFTVFPVAFNVASMQGFSALWKGVGSLFTVQGIQLIAEGTVAEFTPFPREVNRHSSWSRVGQHLALKWLAFAATTPFIASSLVEVVQSEVTSEQVGVLHCITEGISRLSGSLSIQSARLLPVYTLIIPTATYQLLHYCISSLAQYSLEMHNQDADAVMRDSADDLSVTPPHRNPYLRELLARFTGSLMAELALYPWLTILNRLYVQGTRTIIDNTDSGLGVVPINTKYEGVFDCAVSIFRDEGVAGFYKGLGSLVLQYMVHAAVLRLTHLAFAVVEDLRHEAERKRRRDELRQSTQPSQR